VCGGAMADALPNLVKAMVPLIVQSPQVVAWFTRGTQFLLWLELVMALRPVAEAVHAHHVAGTVMVTKDGEVVASQRREDGVVVPLAEAPPRPREDQSMYSTQVASHVPPVHATA
jgi:hypothetical protein